MAGWNAWMYDAHETVHHLDVAHCGAIYRRGIVPITCVRRLPSPSSRSRRFARAERQRSRADDRSLGDQDRGNYK